MWSPDDPNQDFRPPKAGTLGRRRLIAGLAALPLAGCGFAPVHAPGGPGARLRGRVAIEVPRTPMGYRLGDRLEERLGRAAEADLRLAVTLDVDREATAIARDGDATRYTLLGAAPFRLTDGAQKLLAEGEARSFTAYSATGSTVATETARDDAESRLAIILADLVVTRLIAALA